MRMQISAIHIAVICNNKPHTHEWRKWHHLSEEEWSCGYQECHCRYLDCSFYGYLLYSPAFKYFSFPPIVWISYGCMVLTFSVPPRSVILSYQLWFFFSFIVKENGHGAWDSVKIAWQLGALVLNKELLKLANKYLLSHFDNASVRYSQSKLDITYVILDIYN